uniref:Uncharacterized protein n=1 Tax=Zea mays TaxID=4577 RepID=C0HGI0_MAIZE|nr:unknown [Zea mays]
MYTKFIYAPDMFPIIIMYTYRRVRAISGGAALEPLGDAGEVLALVEGVLQLQFRRPPRPVPGERARAVRAAAVHALHVEYLGAERVPHRHEHHPVVRQLRHRRQPGRHAKGETLPTASAIRSVGAARGRKHVVKKGEETAAHGVVSWPPPWEPVLKKRPAGLPARLCSRHSPPVASKKAFICAAIMPNRVGNPKRTPSASASSCGVMTGASVLGGAPILPSTSSDRISGTFACESETDGNLAVTIPDSHNTLVLANSKIAPLLTDTDLPYFDLHAFN